LDGTLINSIPDLTDALNHTATLFDRKGFKEADITKMVGAGVSKLIERAFETKKGEKLFDEVFSAFLEYYNNNHSNYSYLYDGVEEELNRLHQSGKKLAVLSNKLDRFTKQIAKDFAIEKYFSIVLGATDKLKPKPSGEAINFIIDRLGITREMVLMVGDSQPDILAAKDACIDCVAVTYGYRPEEKLKEFKPDFMIDKISKLKGIIE
jgi:phosphoglycolate phosphatase